jgi:hypothetical protein
LSIDSSLQQNLLPIATAKGLWLLWLCQQCWMTPFCAQLYQKCKVVRASPAVFSMRSCTVKLDAEKQKYLAQEIGFGSA